jgi:TonB family protein
VETLIEIGDWHLFKEEPDKALSHYRQAAQILIELKRAAPDTTQDPLAFPVRVYYPTPHAIARGNRLAPDQREEAFAQLEFDVLPDGTVENAVVTNSNTYSRHMSEILSAFREARFRPKFVNGEPVKTVAMSFRETYPVKRLPNQENEDPS